MLSSFNNRNDEAGDQPENGSAISYSVQPSEILLGGTEIYIVDVHTTNLDREAFFTLVSNLQNEMADIEQGTGPLYLIALDFNQAGDFLPLEKFNRDGGSENPERANVKTSFCSLIRNPNILTILLKNPSESNRSTVDQLRILSNRFRTTLQVPKLITADSNGAPTEQVLELLLNQE